METVWKNIQSNPVLKDKIEARFLVIKAIKVEN